jgi:hypothetical protein
MMNPRGRHTPRAIVGILDGGRLLAGVQRGTRMRVTVPVVTALALVMSGCSFAEDSDMGYAPGAPPCHSYAGYGSEEAKREASDLVVEGTITDATSDAEERIYDLTVENVIREAPGRESEVVRFSVPTHDCDGTPTKLSTFEVGDRVQAYLRAETEESPPAPWVVLSPLEGLEAVEG